MRIPCVVCDELVDTEVAHTYHDIGCPLRDADPEAEEPLTPDDCAGFGACGADVHECCCPTCEP